MNIEEIMRRIPHRYPMLLIDRIISISEEGKKCRSLKNVTVNEPFFQGHYPGNPIMPGVLIIEAMAQAGAALILNNESYIGLVPLIGSIDGVKFKRPVTPRDQLIIDTEMLWVRGTVGKIRSEATVDGEQAATMEMVFKLVKQES